MKISLKTGFWKEESLEDWKERFANYHWLMLVFFTANTLFFLIVGNYIMAGINVFPSAIITLIGLSHNKYQKEVYDENRRKEKPSN